MLRLTNLSLPLHHADEALPAAIYKRLRISPREVYVTRLHAAGMTRVTSRT